MSWFKSIGSTRAEKGTMSVPEFSCGPTINVDCHLVNVCQVLLYPRNVWVCCCIIFQLL